VITAAKNGLTAMRVDIHFYSYFKELAGCAETSATVAENGTIQDLLTELAKRFPKWAPLQNSTLIAVGVEYQTRDYVVKAGDQVSLFPPVQGG
jgi:molybdopterin converting factor small subunit